MGLPDNLDALEREASTLASTDGAETLVRKERLRDLIAELRAARAVVEAARAYVERIEAEAAECEPWNAPELDRGICTAVAEYDRLTGERQ